MHDCRMGADLCHPEPSRLDLFITLLRMPDLSSCAVQYVAACSLRPSAPGMVTVSRIGENRRV